MAPSKHVKVVIRTRPTADFSDVIRLSPDQKCVNIHISKSEDGGYINNQQENWDFKFDRVLHNASQEVVYEDCAAPIVRALFDGYNGTVMAYGQTGAGKTFTMTGATENYKHRGIIPRAISQVFREIADRPQMAVTVRIGYLEIYNESLVDLLASLDPDAPDRRGLPDGGLTVVDDKNGVATVKGQVVAVANSEEEALYYLFEGEANRSIADHLMNKNSTRSHCVFTIHVESRSRVESSEKVTYSKLNLVDLAGSERLSKTNSSGVTLKEAMYINKSLTFLEQVIIALADKRRDHVPYRQSKLSNVLRDALGGNCNTLMIGNIWGERAHIEETISTLRFATRMMCVTNAPVVNVQYDPMALIKKYEREVRELKQELAMHDTLSNRSHIQYEPFTDAQKYELQKAVKAFLENSDSEIEIVNLRQIRECFNQFRTLYCTLQAEQEDWQRSAQNTAAQDGGAKAKAPAAAAADRGGDGADRPEPQHHGASAGGGDDGVGELERSSFGIGVAPAHARPVAPIAAASVRDLRMLGRSVREQSTGSLEARRRKSTVRGGQPGGGGGVSGGGGVGATNEPRLEGVREAALAEEFEPPASVHRKAEFAGEGEPPGNAAGAGKRVPGVAAPPPNRAEEFENFKRARGAELNRILNENKNTLKEKKLVARDLAENVNACKGEIDDVKAKIAKKRQDREGRDQHRAQNEAVLVVDEEEYALVARLKELKQSYRDGFEALRQARTEVEYCTRLVDSCRSKLMTEFESWYENTYGAEMGELENSGKNSEDVMDIGEKFDKLQLERMSSEDPDSYAFYNARKNTSRKVQKLSPLKAKRGGKTAPVVKSQSKQMLLVA